MKCRATIKTVLSFEKWDAGKHVSFTEMNAIEAHFIRTCFETKPIVFINTILFSSIIQENGRITIPIKFAFRISNDLHKLSNKLN